MSPVVSGFQFTSKVPSLRAENNLKNRVQKVCNSNEISHNKYGLSAYCKSKRVFCSEELYSRSPCTCARPVMPGFTFKRRCCHSEYWLVRTSGSGRGPTKLICPRRTFHSCGTSVILIRSKKDSSHESERTA